MTMAKPKRFSTAQEFELQMIQVIDARIDKSNSLPELERKDIQVKEIAHKFDITPNTLRRWCKEYTGKSAKTFLAEYRIDKAKQLLQVGYKPLHVAHQLGFTEHKTFSTVFRRVTNTTPSAIRAQGI